jgi:hypothetical protein
VRDVALNFSTRADDRILDIVKPKTLAQAQALLLVVGGLLMAARLGRWVHYSRDWHWYVGLTRYHGQYYSYRLITWAVDQLCKEQLIEDQRVLPGPDNMVRSRMRATPKLVDLMAGVELVRMPPREVLELRDADKNPIDYRETMLTRARRRQVQAFNEAYEDIGLSIEHPAIKRVGEHCIFVGPELCRGGNKAGVTVMWEPRPHLRRIHNRWCWFLGGRFVGFFQQLPGPARGEILINGVKVVRLDLVAIHTTILYNLAGIKLDGDPYIIAGFTRDEVKLGMNIAYNAVSLGWAKTALARRWAELDGRDSASKAEQARAERILAAICERHKAIAHAFGTDQGVRLQFVDSEIIRLVLETCIKEGIPALPVHDEIITTEQHAGRVTELMKKFFAELAPGPNPARVKNTPRSPYTDSTSSQRYPGGPPSLSVIQVVTTKALLEEENGYETKG